MNLQLQNDLGYEPQVKTRRNFLWQGTAGLLGLTLCPAQAAWAAPVWQSNLFLKFAARFAENVAFGLVSSYIYDHIKNYLNPAQATYVEPKLRGNETLGLLTSPKWSGVYGTWDRSWLTKPAPKPYFFTPLLKDDRVNGAAQFFDLRHSPQRYWAGTLAAPSLVGLAKAAPEMRRRGIISSANQLQAALLPVGGGQLGMSCGCFENSYQEPDEYLSELGRVWIDYQRTNRSSGVVHIEVFDQYEHRRFAAEYCACL